MGGREGTWTSYMWGGQTLVAGEAGGQGFKRCQLPLSALGLLSLYGPLPSVSLSSAMASQNLLPKPTVSNFFFKTMKPFHQPQSSRMGKRPNAGDRKSLSSSE